MKRDVLVFRDSEVAWVVEKDNNWIDKQLIKYGYPLGLSIWIIYDEKRKIILWVRRRKLALEVLK